MDSRHDWAWLRERLDRSREHVPGIAPLEDEEAPENAAFRHTLAKVQKQSALAHVAGRPYGGIPFIMSSGDCMQLPPVGAKAHYDTSNPTDKNKACGIGRLEFKEFLHGSGPLDDAEAPSRSVTVVMDNVFRQDDGEFKKVLSEMRDGAVTYESAQLCMTRRLSVLPPQERALFEREALHVFPTWNRTHAITKRYLLHLCGDNAPVAKITSKYSYPRGRKRKNHVKDELKWPVRLAVCKGAKVMLLTNYVVEEDLKNGSMGTVVDIVYDSPGGPTDPNSNLLYIVVDFPHSTVPPDEAWDSNNPTHIPVPVATQRCEAKCCSQTTVPLRVCKAISIYKSQGMTVGPGCDWGYVVVGLPGPNDRSNGAGQELVGMSRATDIIYLAFADDEPISLDMFLKLGKGKACDKKREFEQKLKNRQAASQEWLVNCIKSQDTADIQTFEGGCEALFSWFDQFIPPRGVVEER
jgi:hypothetical protein